MRFWRISVLFMTLLAQAQILGATTFKENFPEEFSAEMKKFFHEVNAKAYTRLFSDDKVAQCIAKNTRIDYVDPTTVTEHHGKEYLAAGGLFKTQMTIFRQHIKNGADLPDINIKLGYKDGFAYAWAHYGLVWADEVPGRMFWHGKFEVTINAAKLLENDSTDVWAGVMAHEMLHNLMHAHEDAAKVGQEKAYANDILINTAQNCIVNHQDVRNYAGTYRCGGRQP